MLSRVYSCAVIGLDGVIVEVEVDFGQGLPHMAIVGLPDAAVQESRERVYSAIKNAGMFYPRKALTVNLAPASVRKEGPAYDLPIALGVLVAADQISAEALEGSLAVGELSLDGTVRHVRGVLPMAATARQQGFKRIFVPEADATEAALIPELEVIPVRFPGRTVRPFEQHRADPSASADQSRGAGSHRHDRPARDQGPGACQARPRGGRLRLA